MSKILLSPRLQMVADSVRQDAIFADIGTDHALLPLFLLNTKRIQKAVATDLRAGPLQKAQANIDLYGHKEELTLVQTNGLEGLFPYALEDIAICGMGGELIRDILNAANWIQDSKYHLLLQPASRSYAVRTYLAEHGFRILQEQLVEIKPHFYPLIVAEYDGTPYELTPLEAELGPYILKEHASIPLYDEYIGFQYRKFQKRITGQRKSGLEDPRDLTIFLELEKLYDHL